MKILTWHSPRTGSNLLMNMLHQTGIIGVANYEQCGFPLGSIGTIKPHKFQDKLQEYEASQTTDNGVFNCKLSWEGLIHLINQVGLAPVYAWLETIDKHVYLYRHDTIGQAVSMFIAGKRAYFSTLKLDKGETILPTPDYSYEEIAYRRMIIERHRAEMETYFEDFCIEPLRISYEAMTITESSIQETVKLVLSYCGLECDKIEQIRPEIRKQVNPAKEQYKDRFLIDWADRSDSPI